MRSIRESVLKTYGCQLDEPCCFSGDQMQQCFNVFTDIHKVLFPVLFHCCVLLEIKLIFYYYHCHLPLPLPLRTFSWWQVFYGDSRSSMGKGAADEDYQGHRFWDTEMYMIPAVLMFRPTTVKKMLQYRTMHAEQAQQKAEVSAWASYQRRKIVGCACAGPGTFSPPPTSKETGSQRSQHASRHVRDAHAVVHCGIAYPGVAVKTFPAFPAHVHPAIVRIWPEANGIELVWYHIKSRNKG